MNAIRTQPLTASGFAPFGDILEVGEKPDMIINQGLCGRHHDLASLAFDEGQAAISIFDAEPRTLPYQLDMMERHPRGSQAFIPLFPNPFLVIVASDNNGKPEAPQAFLTAAGQGINLHRNTWHGVLTPLAAPGVFAVIDRVGPGNNLEEFWFDTPFSIVST